MASKLKDPLEELQEKIPDYQNINIVELYVTDEFINNFIQNILTTVYEISYNGYVYGKIIQDVNRNYNTVKYYIWESNFVKTYHRYYPSMVSAMLTLILTDEEERGVDNA